MSEHEELERKQMADLERVKHSAQNQERGQFDHHAELREMRKKMEAEDAAREFEDLADEEGSLH